MAIEATIVEQLQELRRWQLEQQEKLIREQQEQRESLSNEQNRMYEALSLSIEEITSDEQTLKKFIEEHKKEKEDLIDFDTPDEECLSLALQKNQKSHNPNMLKLPFKTKADFKPNIKYNDSYNQDYSLDDTVSSMYSLSSGRIKNQNRSIAIDDIPVPSPKKDFNTLLEERLKDSEATVNESGKKPIVKRPFLKKGEGLVRYMPNSNKTKTKPRPRSASFGSSTQSTIVKSSKSSNLGRSNSAPKAPKSYENTRKSISNPTPPPQRKLNLKNVAPAKKKIFNRPVNSKSNSNSFERKNAPEKVSDTSISDLDMKNKKEQEEIRIFELLEDKAENSSFCSTSSTVIAFLQQSTPLKHKALLHSAAKNQISFNDIGDQTLEELCAKVKSNQKTLVPLQQKNTNEVKVSQWDNIPVSKLKNDKTVSGTVLPYGPDVDQNYQEYSSVQETMQDENNGSFHVRFSEYNEYKTMTDTSSISSESQTIINYSNDKGAWSDCSATTDSSDVESILSSRIKSNNQEKENKKLESLNYLNKSKNQVDTDEDNTEDDKNDEDRDEEDDEDRDEEDDEDETDIKNETLQKDDTVIEEKDESLSIFKSEFLKRRLLELEQEIEIFRKENAALTLQRQKLEEERTKLREERINMQRTLKKKEEALEMEKQKTENILQEEKKRLAREKAALESRMKDANEKAQKSKQERQTIQALREELEQLKEEYNDKESKWNATNARQRSQMRVLQTEVSRLKQELEKLQQKKTAKLRKPIISNTRSIHHINKYLADRKKISPFKNDDDCNEKCLKISNNQNVESSDANYDVVEPAEETSPEPVIEKKKILKTAESIARTRNLYEKLLKDATESFSEIEINRKMLENEQVDTPDSILGEKLNQEENSYDEESDEESNNLCISESPKTHRVMEVETEKLCDDKLEQGNNMKPYNNKQGIQEIHHRDGHIEYRYPNKNIKKVFPDKGITKMIYYNGDIRETDKNGTVKYYYASTSTWHTTMPDGLEILQFPNGQVERRSKNGTIEVSFPDGSVRVVQADGSQKWALKDGTIGESSADGEMILTLPNGQKEIHTKDHKRREYPDGTIKIVYPDGIQETRYANGRVRLKDKVGNLIMDTHQC